ncbi:MAG: hypothetical protein K6E13_04240 [Lachnospiraceae bacterium]|nr:hypothetical protein [Lachnospiraceae bacterium]
MNTKPLPAAFALIAGALVCIISFIQQVDMVVFAQRFIIATLVFLLLGVIAKIVLDRNFKEEVPEDNESEEDDEIEDDEDNDSGE